MTAPKPHGLDFPVTEAREGRGMDDAGATFTLPDNLVGQGVGASPRSVAEDSKPPL
jgi:hypothetical protein